MTIPPNLQCHKREHSISARLLLMFGLVCRLSKAGALGTGTVCAVCSDSSVWGNCSWSLSQSVPARSPPRISPDPLPNTTSKQNHNGMPPKVNKKSLLFLSRTEKELVCQNYAFLQCPRGGFSSCCFSPLPLLLPLSPRRVSPLLSHSCPACLKAG